ncbi:MAG: MmgE/PrpD family protein [Pigmentiphaga sp.]
MPSPELALADFVHRLSLDDVPAEAQAVVQHMMMAVIGTGMAGAGEDGIAALREILCEAGGAPQATTLVFGDRLPAAAAAQFNATMCRALDYCDAMAPGPHIGSSLFTAALAAAELAGGCSGREFLTALVAGAELGARFNLSEAQYDGFDPTGICVVFAAAGAAARLLGLTPEQTLHALALAFNRCGGSFQSHVDGSLGVRVVQGWVAQAGVECAQMAQRGITGPVRFLSGHYGYAHLYGRGTLQPGDVAADLGREWRLRRMMFKKYPSCGVTQGVTELTLALMAEHGIAAADVASGEVRLPPYAHRLVGHAFQIGGNPRVDAQFNAGFCVANALVRGSSRLQHFTPAAVAEPRLRPVIERIAVLADGALDARGHSAVDLSLTLRDGRVLRRGLDVAPGYPGADLAPEQHLARFRDCLDYAPWTLDEGRAATVLAAIDDLSALADIRQLLPSLVVPEAGQPVLPRA